MKIFINSTIASGIPVSGIPEANFRKQLYVHNVSPVRIKFGWEGETTWDGLTEGVPLEPGDYRTFGGMDLDLRGKLHMITDSLAPSLTGDTTNGGAVVTDLLNVTANVLAGMKVTGAGIPDDTYIASVDSATQVTLTRNATATANNVALTLSAPLVYTQR